MNRLRIDCHWFEQDKRACIARCAATPLRGPAQCEGCGKYISRRQVREIVEGWQRNQTTDRDWRSIEPEEAAAAQEACDGRDSCIGCCLRITQMSCGEVVARMLRAQVLRIRELEEEVHRRDEGDG